MSPDRWVNGIRFPAITDFFLARAQLLVTNTTPASFAMSVESSARNNWRAEEGTPMKFDISEF
jgi:hypothetical protein